MASCAELIGEHNLAIGSSDQVQYCAVGQALCLVDRAFKGIAFVFVIGFALVTGSVY